MGKTRVCKFQYNKQYFETLKQVSEKEYSSEQHQAIKTVFIHKNAIADYINNLDIQYHNIKLLYNDITPYSSKSPDSI